MSCFYGQQRKIQKEFHKQTRRIRLTITTNTRASLNKPLQNSASSPNFPTNSNCFTPSSLGELDSLERPTQGQVSINQLKNLFFPQISQPTVKRVHQVHLSGNPVPNVLGLTGRSNPRFFLYCKSE